MFDDLTDEELVLDREKVSVAGLEAARQLATDRLLNGPGAGLGERQAVQQLLMARPSNAPEWERLAPYEIRWSLLVLRLVADLQTRIAAIRDAKRRGATWAGIGAVLGVTASTAHTRFAKFIQETPEPS